MTLDHSLVSQPKLSHVKEDASVRLSREYDALGFYYSDHPALALRQHYKTQADSLIVNKLHIMQLEKEGL